MTAPSNRERQTDVLVLVGGKGTRLRTVVNDRPKPMAVVGNRPFLDYLLDYVSSFGFNRIILCAGYMSGHLKEHYINADRNQDFVLSIEDEPLGTGGAIKNAEPLIKTDPFIVMNGDSFCPVDFNDLLAFHVRKNARVSMIVTKSESTNDYGSILMDREGGISSFREKAPGKNSSLINAGVYAFSRSLLAQMPPDRRISLENELFPALCGKGLYGLFSKNSVLDIGTPERYESAKQRFAVK